MKAVGVSLTVIIELVIVAFEYATWKTQLKRKAGKAIDSWKDETIPVILQDLDKLREENIETINQIASDIEHTFETDVSHIEHSKEELKSYIDMCDEIGHRIGVIE